MLLIRENQTIFIKFQEITADKSWWEGWFNIKFTIKFSKKIGNRIASSDPIDAYFSKISNFKFKSK